MENVEFSFIVSYEKFLIILRHSTGVDGTGIVGHECVHFVIDLLIVNTNQIRNWRASYNLSGLRGVFFKAARGDVIDVFSGGRFVV